MTKKEQYKILFTGPVGAGKTTAIRSISDKLPVMTDVSATDETKRRKSQTTVAMDYGTMRISRSEIVHLYGTPGQDRFDFMWEILQKGALGLVVLVDNAREDPIADLAHFIDSYEELIRRTAVVVGITRSDVRATPPRADYVDWLSDRDLVCPVFTVDAREREDVAVLLRSLLHCLDPQAVAQ